MALDLDIFKTELGRIEGNNRPNYLKDFVRFPAKDGSLIVRILPPRDDHETIYVALRNHTINEKRVPCARELVGGAWKGNCPICDWYSNLWKQSDNPELSENQSKALQDTARSIKPLERYFYNVIVRKEIQEDGTVLTDVGPKILSIGKELHTYIIKSIVGDAALNKRGLGDITDISTGRDLNIIKKLKGGFPNYSESEFMDASSLGKDKKLVKEWLSNMHDLKGRRKTMPYEELLREINVFRGIAVDESESFKKEDYERNETAVKPQPKQEKVVISSAVSDDDTALAEDDFLKDLDIDNI